MCICNGILLHSNSVGEYYNLPFYSTFIPKVVYKYFLYICEILYK